MAGFVVIWVAFAVIATIIGSQKGMTGTGLFLGLFLGLIGVIIIAVMKGDPYARVTARPVGGAGWYDDPLGRHAGRYYNGQSWTKFVGRTNADGTRTTFEEQV